MIPATMNAPPPRTRAHPPGDDPLLRDPPFLENGERLDQPTFHALYERMPEGFRAELVGGVVYFITPVSAQHADPDGLIGAWLGYYRLRTPGVVNNPNATLLLGRGAEPQPDLLLRVLPSHGGRVRLAGKYFAGAPELVVETAVSSASRDLGGKLADYWQAGVDEYLVLLATTKQVLWHVRGPEGYVLLEPDADGLLKSRLFGGLWLDPAALVNDDPAALIAGLERGLASPDHAATVTRLAAAARVAGTAE